jgi:hypothetical protein
VTLTGDEGCVDVHLAHVVDDHSDSPAVPVRQDVVEQGGLAGAEEAGQHGYRKSSIRLRCHALMIIIFIKKFGPGVRFNWKRLSLSL